MKFKLKQLVFPILVCLHGLIYAQGGIPDQTFGWNGLVFTRVDTFSEMAFATKIGSQGELFTVGNYNP